MYYVYVQGDPDAIVCQDGEEAYEVGKQKAREGIMTECRDENFDHVFTMGEQ